MTKRASKHPDVSGPQSVTKFIKLKTDSEAIQIGFTNQRVSPHGGLITFAGFVQWHRLSQRLKEWLPLGSQNPKAIDRADLALGFMAGLNSYG